MFDGTIRHEQAVFEIKILSMPPCARNFLFNQERVFRMNPLKGKVQARFRGSAVLEDSKRLC
jgi:hypothetical protein